MDQLWDGPRVPSKSRDFVQAFVRIAAMHGVPVLCRAYDDQHVEIIHAQYLGMLLRDDWIVLAQIGTEAAESCQIKVLWGGAEAPAVWILPGSIAREKT